MDGKVTGFGMVTARQGVTGQFYEVKRRKEILKAVASASLQHGVSAECEERGMSDKLSRTLDSPSF